LVHEPVSKYFLLRWPLFFPISPKWFLRLKHLFSFFSVPDPGFPRCPPKLNRETLVAPCLEFSMAVLLHVSDSRTWRFCNRHFFLPVPPSCSNDKTTILPRRPDPPFFPSKKSILLLVRKFPFSFPSLSRLFLPDHFFPPPERWPPPWHHLERSPFFSLGWAEKSVPHWNDFFNTTFQGLSSLQGTIFFHGQENPFSTANPLLTGFNDQKNASFFVPLSFFFFQRLPVLRLNSQLTKRPHHQVRKYIFLNA